MTARHNFILDLNSLQKYLKYEIHKAKLHHKQMVEHKLSTVCGLPGLVVVNGKERKKVALEGFTSDFELAQDKFYSRLSVHDFNKQTAVSGSLLLFNCL